MYQKTNFWVKAATTFFNIFILLGNYGWDLLAIYLGRWQFGLWYDLSFEVRGWGGRGCGFEMSHLSHVKKLLNGLWLSFVHILSTCVSFLPLLAMLRMCFQALGMETGRIPNSAIRASSQWDGNHNPTRARLNSRWVISAVCRATHNHLKWNETNELKEKHLVLKEALET